MKKQMHKDTILGISKGSAAVIKGGKILAAQEERFTRIKNDSSYPAHAIKFCMANNKIDCIAHTEPLLEGINAKTVQINNIKALAASAYYPSPFKKAAILVMHQNKYAIFIGDTKIRNIEQGIFKASELYSEVTEQLGLVKNRGEYKVMGLAAYGKPIYEEFENIEPIIKNPTQKQKDIAASIQNILEIEILQLCQKAKQLTKSDNLCLAGSIALNCVANSKIKKSKIFNDIWIQPAGGAGASIGAALLSNQQRIQHNSFLGPGFSDEQIRTELKKVGQKYEKTSNRAKSAARLLAQGKIVAYFAGRMEFGPRALGARSILADPRNINTKDKLNKIKRREAWRPFAPVIMAEHSLKYFDLDNSPYMLLVAQVKNKSIPAVTHIDNSARIQIVEQSQDFYKVISEFYKLTRCPVLVNTSFNVRGEPIVCTPKDALECFLNTEIDALIIENNILYK